MQIRLYVKEYTGRLALVRLVKEKAFLAKAWWCVLSIRHMAEADGQNRSVAPFLGFLKVNIKIIAQDCYLTNFPNTSVQILLWELLLFKL